MNWTQAKEVALEKLKSEVGESGRSPDYVGIARGLIAAHSWATNTETLRQKMRHWWATSRGMDKQRKAEKREQKRTEEPVVESQAVCALTTHGLVFRQKSAEAEEARVQWATELLKQLDVELPVTLDKAKYHLAKSTEVANAAQKFKFDSMAIWKKHKPPMPQQIEIIKEAQRALRWWRANRLDTGEAGNEFINLCKTPAPKKKRENVTYSNLSQITLDGLDVDGVDGIVIPQEVARDVGPPRPIIFTPPPPFPGDVSKQWWYTRANGDDTACISSTGFCVDTCERLWMVYGENMFVTSREVLWAVLNILKTGALASTWQTAFPLLGKSTTVKAVIHDAFEFLAASVNEVDPSLRFSPYNHCPHFPSAGTCFCDVVPVGSTGGDFSKELYSGYYSQCVFKVLVVTDLLLGAALVLGQWLMSQ